MNDITILGHSLKKNDGVSRYTKDLVYNMPNADYKEYYKKEIIKNNKKHFGYISSILYQPFYKINTDIIHTLSTVNFYYKSNVATIHDLYFDNNIYKLSTLSFLMPMIIKYKLGRLKIIVPSELVKEQFKKYFHSDKNIYVVPHGINYDYIDSLNLYNPFKTEKNIVIAGGVDFKRRNQVYLLDKLKHSNYNIFVIGYGFMDILKEKYKAYYNMHFFKNLPDNEFYSYLKYSDLNLYNTIGEGFGYLIYESLYLGKKMLVNYNHDNMLLFKNYANYYTDENILQQIDLLMNTEYKFMKNDLIKNYSIKSMVENTLKVYSAV